MLKRLFLTLTLASLLGAGALWAQYTQTATLSNSSTDCSTANSCLILAIPHNNGGATLTVAANASGNTIQFEATGDGGTTWGAINAYPSNSTTPATSTTGTGTWQVNVAGYTQVRMRMSTLAGGTTTVSATPSTASASSGKGGGGGGSGTITNQVANGISSNSSGTATAVDSTVCTPPTTPGQFTAGYTVPSTSSVPPTCPQVGVVSRVISGATATDTIGALTINDSVCMPIFQDQNASGVLVTTIPTPTTLANANACVIGDNHSAQTGTLKATTWTLQSGTSAAVAGATGIPVPPGTHWTALVDPFNATNWLVSMGPEEDATNGISLAGTLSSGNKVFVTSDYTDSSSGSLQIITGLTWTLPTSKAVNYSFHCELMFDQATAAVVDKFGVGVTGTAPTNLNADGRVFAGTSGAWTASGVLTGLASTTPTSVVSFTPSAITTVWTASLDGTVEQPSNATPGVFSIYAYTTTGTDNFIVKRGSYCSLF